MTNKIKLTAKARILLWFCGFIPYRLKNSKKRRKTFLWPIEKCVSVIKSMTIEKANAKMKLQRINSLQRGERQYGRSALMYFENQIIFLADSQIRGYKRLALKKGWVKIKQ